MFLKRGGLLMIAGVLLILTAGFFTYRNFVDERDADQAASDTVTQMQKIIPGLEQKPEESSGEAGAEDEASRLAAQVEPPVIETPEMQTIEIDGHTYIGEISIPSQELNLPVSFEWSYPLLKKSPCRYAGSYLDDTLIIAGHSYPRHFRVLRQMQPGDSVVFTDTVGNVIQYEVVKAETLGKYDVDALFDGDWDLTLFSCTYGGVHRIVIRCNRTGSN